MSHIITNATSDYNIIHWYHSKKLGAVMITDVAYCSDHKVSVPTVNVPARHHIKQSVNAKGVVNLRKL